MAIYYVSNSGNDNNDGLSINSPWRTINKVNNFSLLPNDTVCFKCGDYWREQLVPKGGNSSANITYTKYGTGALPLFMGSAKANISTDWVNAGTNLWKNTTWWTAANALPSDVGNIIVDGEICGWKYFDLGSLKKQLDYFCDHTDNYSVTMYSTKNPATLYSMVELAFFRDIIHNDQIPYITIDSLELKYGGSHGYGGVGQWGGGNNVHHINVLNCVIHHMGGGSDTDNTRLGNAVQFYAGANDCLVQGNHIYQIYDSGCTNQSGSDNSSEYNITYTNNIIDTCEMSFEYWMSGANNVMHDINFVDNVCTNAGKGWAHIQRPDKIGTHVMEWGNVANQYNINITGNTFDTATEQLIYSWHVDQLYPVHYDKNNYVQPTNDASHTYLLFQSALASDITINNYVDWIIRYNQDQNSTFNGKTLIINNLDIADINQITSISKVRIYKPKNLLKYNPATWAEWWRTNAVPDNIAAITINLTAASWSAVEYSNLGAIPNTKYGLLLNVVSNTLISSKISLGGQLSGTMSDLILAGQTGNVKKIFTTKSTITSNELDMLQATQIDANSNVKIKDVRLFELPSGSRIEADFTNAATQAKIDALCLKYPWR